jgi:two-component system cell cycle sensor histidine kinase/response regulator CckA
MQRHHSKSKQKTSLYNLFTVKSLRSKLSLSLIVTLIYGFTFLLLYQWVGKSAIALSLLPVLIVANLFGLWGGLLAGLVSYPFNTMLFIISGDAQFSLTGTIHLFAHGSLLCVGGFAGYMHDIRKRLQQEIAEHIRTEELLRKSEEKLLRSKKMEFIGLLAGGVAHDLNNVLSGIVTYPDLLLMQLPEDSELIKPIRTIKESGQRAVAIVQDLLTIARGVAITKEPLNINELIKDYLISPEFKKLQQFHPTVTVRTELDKALFNIKGSDVHITKAIMNLVSNASEAIIGSGNVTISTVNSYVDRPLKGYDDINTGEYVILSVSDDGPGIPLDDLEKIFDPFFTKKTMGRSGTGLGLTVVWNVLQDHQGYINVKSDKNGTIFDLYFPITRDEISDQNISRPIGEYKGNGETILVVDDVESQREISCHLLELLGYTPVAVSSGEEAVDFVKKNAVDLLLLDMIMDPGINGLETYKRIVKNRPNQKAIIVSGFAETDDVKAARKLGAGKYMNKPLTIEKLGLAIQDELRR